MDYERQGLIDMLRRLGRTQAAADAVHELPERASRQEVEDFAKRHGIQSEDELTDLMGGSPCHSATVTRRAAARSCSVVPPQMPWTCSVRSANARHSRRTRQAAQIALAFAACSRAGPEAEIGKNRSGSADRQAAADRHPPSMPSCDVPDSSARWRSRASLTSPPPRSSLR
jgi:hypothetical protein